jgi:nicotinate-nucleotide adenylyltransferase
MKIGIFPGSFDPIHTGHIALAAKAADALSLDQVIFVPSGVSPNKRRTQKTPGNIRHAWIQKALQDAKDPRLQVTDLESRMNVVTYTLETIQALGNQFPGSSLFLLVGNDTAQRIQRWPSKDAINKSCTIIAFSREGSAEIPGIMQVSGWQPMPHASSEIKKRILVGETTTGLIPEAIREEVETWFKKNP